MKTPRPKPTTKIAAEFVRAHLGRGAFAPLTGTDFRAWNAFVYLIELWGYTRDQNVISAMKACLECAQTRHEEVMQVFVQTIPGVLDWSDVRTIWPQIAPPQIAHYRAVGG